MLYLTSPSHSQPHKSTVNVIVSICVLRKCTVYTLWSMIVEMGVQGCVEVTSVMIDSWTRYSKHLGRKHGSKFKTLWMKTYLMSKALCFWCNLVNFCCQFSWHERPAAYATKPPTNGKSYSSSFKLNILNVALRENATASLHIIWNMEPHSKHITFCV